MADIEFVTEPGVKRNELCSCWTLESRGAPDVCGGHYRETSPDYKSLGFKYPTKDAALEAWEEEKEMLGDNINLWEYRIAKNACMSPEICKGWGNCILSDQPRTTEPEAWESDIEVSIERG